MLQLSHLWDTAILSLRSVQRQEIAIARPRCWSRRHADHAPLARRCERVCSRSPMSALHHRARPRPIPRTQTLRRFPQPKLPHCVRFAQGARGAETATNTGALHGRSALRPDKASLGPADRAFAGTVRRLADALAANQQSPSPGSRPVSLPLRWERGTPIQTAPLCQEQKPPCRRISDRSGREAKATHWPGRAPRSNPQPVPARPAGFEGAARFLMGPPTCGGGGGCARRW
jgi:hypothetical protein